MTALGALVWDVNVARVQDRFPGLSGSILDSAVWRTYVMPGPPTTVQWFEANMRRRCFRHPANRAGQEAVRQAYAKEILKSGIISHARDSPVCVAGSTSDGQVDYFIGGAHLMEAFYIARELEPENDHVIHALANGTSGGHMLCGATPVV